MEHKGTMTLETERLMLRPFRAEDAEDMFRNWASDPEVTRYLTWPTHESIETSKAICSLWEKESLKHDFYQWAIVLKKLGQPIGSISVVRSNETYAWAELGYCIGRSWWGRGITPEALRAVIEYLIREIGFRQVLAMHDADNPNSGAAMRKAGMRKMGVLRRSGSNNSNPCCDLTIYSILAEELDKHTPAFRSFTRVKQALTPEECLTLLSQEKRGVLSVIGDHGYPYGMPINHWYNPQDGKIYFHSGPMGHKIDALQRDNRASFCVMDAGTPEEGGWALNFKSVIVFGKLEIIRDHEQALEISRQISYKFTQDQDYIEAEVRNSGARVLCFALTPEQITGKRVNEK